ncbi:unnamed protein product [Blepharisma stoltei]|uniref:Uncharacterized protein n=1 Tax=Blepharisma stoltei TaxID=1481888 RepID=A0AAU9IDY5_9CILI|nr:unnamed protein product [Blepharisma stoltei]
MGCTSSIKRPKFIVPAENSMPNEEDNGVYYQVNVPKHKKYNNNIGIPLFVVREEVSALEESAAPSKAQSLATNTLQNAFIHIQNNI